MPRTFFAILSVVAGVAVGAVVAPRLAVGIATCGAAGALVWIMSRCRHRGPLGLLPPVQLPDGSHLGARWFCSACGKEWAAEFEHDRTPIVKYAGFDESKARNAAKRAQDLERKTQELALRRAGLPVARHAAARTSEPAVPQPAAASTIVSIQDRRAAVK